jgi:GntR family transcriptional regulator/MocR family aminotransferase
MILPQSLIGEYNKKKHLYNQTVSKADQIALCSYIRDGHLNSQIRKSRKLYTQKSKILTDLLVENFGEKIEILKTNSPLYVRCKFNLDLSTKDLCDRAERVGVLLIPANTYGDFPEIAFSVA